MIDTDPGVVPYTGIGSRKTPEPVLADMLRIGAHFSRMGLCLRTGGADGADTAFETGARSVCRNDPKRLQVYLPTPYFNGRRAGLSTAVPDALAPYTAPGGMFSTGACVYVDDPNIRERAAEIADRFHPTFTKLGTMAQAYMIRNVFQVLGTTLDQPSSFLVCWAPNPRRRGGLVVDVDGGTGLAVRLAAHVGVPILHLGIREHHRKLMDEIASAKEEKPDA